MSGFRPKHGCHNVLLKFVEDVKHSLDNGNIVCTVLTDSFDCLPHRLLIAKMAAYGVNNYSCILMMNYFCGRQQRVKLCDTHSQIVTGWQY